MSGTCKDCRWWLFGPPYGEKFLEEGGQAKCSHPKIGAVRPVSDGATDAESYGGIFTGPDFGCIHFESKEQT